jgi:hypothetical protein
VFDAVYFKEHLPAQIQQLGAGACSVAVHLTDGSRFIVRRHDPDGFQSGYVLLEVYPQEGRTKESLEKRRKPGGTDEVFFDRVAIPYEQITRVFLTLVVPGSEGEREPMPFIGFRAP